METPVTNSSMRVWEIATGHIADVLTQIIGLSSATLAVVVTFRVQLKGGPSWLLKVAFASLPSASVRRSFPRPRSIEPMPCRPGRKEILGSRVTADWVEERSG
jgi:hypothetical protein